MGYNCKDSHTEINKDLDKIEELRNLFIKRMTIDSKTKDRRKKNFNQAIFGWWESDEKEADPSKAFANWTNMTMDMVLQCFDDAVKDYRNSYCDTRK